MSNNNILNNVEALEDRQRQDTEAAASLMAMGEQEAQRAAAKKRCREEAMRLEEEEDKEKDKEGLMMTPHKSKCDRCKTKKLQCRFCQGKHTSSCTQCQKTRAQACVRAQGLPVDIQAHIWCMEKGASPSRKKVKSAPIVDNDEITEGKGKGKEKEKAAEKPLKPAVARGSSMNSGAAVSGSRLTDLARTGAWWSHDPELLSDCELLEHLLIVVQRNRWTSVRVVDLLVDEEEQREELLEEERQVCQDLVVKIVRDEL
ncbi:hypothetical protein ONZ51_g10004 [Trametes cubensis]|uniref:Uncharacterized protein n=1 Tax=Trametes cubensis TaxID=1111947 RepID=A0AAD7X760_9APHY|nr:hypothetical protein ONZ51_g10004 [Trametes cubensis]